MKKTPSGYQKKIVGPKTYERHCRPVEEAVGFMQKHRFRKDFTVTLLVQKPDTNETTLQQAFRTSMGKNLSTYMHERCMAYATKMLLEGKSVNETALESGYSAIGQFSYVFKRTFGVCPSLYAMNAKAQKEKNKYDAKGASRGVVFRLKPALACPLIHY